MTRKHTNRAVTGGDGQHAEPGKDRTDARKSKEKVLLVLSDPAHLGKSVEQKAKIAAVGKTTFYALLRDPRFREELKQARDAALALKVDRLSEASYQVATTAGLAGSATASCCWRWPGNTSLAGGARRSSRA